MTKPSAKTRRRATDLGRKRDEVLEVLRQLTDADLTEIIRRGEESVAPGITGGGGPPSLSFGRPTEARALAALSWRYDDPVGDAIEELCAELVELHGLARRIRQKASYVLRSAETARGRVSSLQGKCRACERDVVGSEGDRLRSGYCDYAAGEAWSGCYRKWLEQGRPDRLAYEAWVKAEMMASNGAV